MRTPVPPGGWNASILPGDGWKLRARIFGVDAALDHVAAKRRQLVHRQRLAGGDADLLLHEVDAGEHLRHRMLHLDAGVHLHEVERPVLVEQHLDRAGADVVDRLARRRPPRRPCAAEARASSRDSALSSISFWWRRCTEQSRSPRWITLPCLSPMIWNSMCRGRARYFSTYTSPLPNADSASLTRELERAREVVGVLSRRACPCRRRRPPP